MDTAGLVPDVALAPAELVRLYEQDGPVVTVYLATEAKIPQASQRSVTRWQDLRTTLKGRGVPAPPLDSIAGVVADAHHGGEGLAVVAGDAGVRHIEHLGEAPAVDRGYWEGLPALAPVLHGRQGHLSHVIVLADREGADIHVAGPTGGERRESAGSSGYPVAKVAPGGWSQTHNQRRAEGNWASSAKVVAAEVERVAAEVEAAVVVAGGDERALTLLSEQLDEHWRERLHVVAGGTGDLEREARRLVADAAARRTVTAIEEFRQQVGERNRAAAGAAETADALRQGRVAVLLVHDDPDDERRAWYGPGTAEISLRPSTDFPGEARMVDVLIRAAFQTGAGIRVVPGAGGPPEGVGALLRWA
jgi:hypothetical protein